MGVRRVQTSDRGPRLDSVTISSPGIPFLVLVCGGPPSSGPERVYRMSLGIAPFTGMRNELIHTIVP
jgi:hypothetical protein